MTAAFLLSLALTAQTKPSPLDYSRGMEIELLDRELQRRRDTVLLTRGQLTTAQRLGGRGKSSQGSVERIAADLKTQEAREAELASLLAIKIHEREALQKGQSGDDPKAFALLLDWIHAREAVAKIDIERKFAAIEQARSSVQRRGVVQAIEDAELAHRTTVAALAEIEMHEARVIWDQARSNVEKPADPARLERLAAESRRARLRSFEILAANSSRRLEIARDRVKLGTMPGAELVLFDKAASEASASFEAEKKVLGAPPTEPGKDSSKR